MIKKMCVCARSVLVELNKGTEVVILACGYFGAHQPLNEIMLIDCIMYLQRGHVFFSLHLFMNLIGKETVKEEV